MTTGSFARRRPARAELPRFHRKPAMPYIGLKRGIGAAGATYLRYFARRSRRRSWLGRKAARPARQRRHREFRLALGQSGRLAQNPGSRLARQARAGESRQSTQDRSPRRHFDGLRVDSRGGRLGTKFQAGGEARTAMSQSHTHVVGRPCRVELLTVVAIVSAGVT